MSTPDAPTGLCNVYGEFPWIQLGQFNVTFQLWGEGPTADPVLVDIVCALLIDGILCDANSTPVNPIQYVQLSRNDGLTAGESYWTVLCPILSAQQVPMTLAAATFDMSALIQA